ncbi:MAG: photosynthetic complex putative assembly protein PuhB [Gammaproteobacteria bacterium]
MTTMTEHDYEAQPGLPESLPESEHIVWQGVPDWRTLALRTFHVRKIAIYFLVLLGVKVALGVQAGEAAGTIIASAAFLTLLAIASVGMLTLFAVLMARTTLYTITSRRLVMRIGVTFSMSINLPFTELKEAALKPYQDGHGDIAVSLMPGHHVSYFVLWPHCKLLHAFDAKPVLRGIPNAEHVAKRFARAVSDASTDVECTPRTAPSSAPGRLATAGS